MATKSKRFARPIDNLSIPTWWSTSSRADIFLICMIYLMLPDGSRILRMIWYVCSGLNLVLNRSCATYHNGSLGSTWSRSWFVRGVDRFPLLYVCMRSIIGMVCALVSSSFFCSLCLYSTRSMPIVTVKRCNGATNVYTPAQKNKINIGKVCGICLLYTSPSPRD